MPSSAANVSQHTHTCRAEVPYSSASSLGPFDILNVKSRVVTPPRPLPLVSYREKAYYFISELFGNEFQIKATQVASDHGIPDVDAALSARGMSVLQVQLPSTPTSTPQIYNRRLLAVSRDDPLDAKPTIVIVADEWTTDSPRLWQSVVEKVKRYVDARAAETAEAKKVDGGRGSSEREISQSARQGRDLSLREGSLTFHQGGNLRYPGSFSATAGHMTAIALFKLGPGIYNNNLKTVYVSVGYELSESGWPPVVEKIRSFLDEFRLGLRAHIEHNTMGPRIFHLRETNLTQAERLEKIRDFAIQPMNPYSASPNAGADIGAGRYLQTPDGKLSSVMLGTLGCWFDINIKGEGWKTVALTNYHITEE